MEHCIKSRIFLEIRNQLFKILIRILEKLCKIRIFFHHIRRKNFKAAADRIRHTVRHWILLNRNQCFCDHGRREILARTAGMSAFCRVGKFKIHISFFAESDGAESFLIDPVIASRADSAAFI